MLCSNTVQNLLAQTETKPKYSRNEGYHSLSIALHNMPLSSVCPLLSLLWHSFSNRLKLLLSRCLWRHREGIPAKETSCSYTETAVGSSMGRRNNLNVTVSTVFRSLFCALPCGLIVIHTVFPPADEESYGDDEQQRDEQQGGDDGGEYTLLSVWLCCTLLLLLFCLSLSLRLLHHSLLLLDSCCLRLVVLWPRLTLD